MDESERKHWVEGLAEFNWQNELIVFAIMCAFTKPKNLLDVGCGTGALVMQAHAVGVDSFGVDQIASVEHPLFKQWDLTQPLDLKRKFDLVTCIEFVEHLQPEYEGVICDTLTRHVSDMGRLILSAAKPGQPGYNHFNCQPQSYWQDRLESRGMVYSYPDTARLASILHWTFTSLHHIEGNLQVFKRE